MELDKETMISVGGEPFRRQSIEGKRGKQMTAGLD
jgi:hypothetical protein